ncbi:hypothetical protein Taro_021797 [Colocasia esculenta]|uniref:Uncharacterized protein n=1 Tax=Colocasia esculenta TaxID=4460 RepID=A0A843V6G5_COLES|nr:hypothetical protein [Colocasia esculenta]
MPTSTSSCSKLRIIIILIVANIDWLPDYCIHLNTFLFFMLLLVSLEGIATLKSLFGLPYGVDGEIVSDEIWKHLHEAASLLDQRNNEDEFFISSTKSNALCQVKDSVKSMILLLKKPDSSSVKAEDLFSEGSDFEDLPSVIPSLHPSPSVTRTSEFIETSPSSHVLRSNGDPEKSTYSSSLGGLAHKFIWECPDTAPDRLIMSSGPTKRRLASSEGSNRRSRDNAIPETVGPNVFPRGVGGTSSSSGPTRRDTFRQRKPNTSRPPSMHVDDYVARERNTDGVGGGTNVLTSQRGGMTSGRPPSIHVDEFMARQRERQNSTAVVAGDAMQTRNMPLMNGNEAEKTDKSQKLKADLDDDLQEINIVFDDESESDDRLPFPQPDDNLQPAPVIAGGSSPGSIVEENESDVNENAQFSQVSTPPPSENGDPNSEVPLRRRVSKAEMLLALEKHAPPEKNHPRHIKEKSFFEEQSAESKYVAPTLKGFDNLPPANINTFASHFYNASPAPSSLQPLGDSVFPATTSYPRDSPQKAVNVSSLMGLQGYHDQKAPISQPPLPPMPPPIFSSVPPQTSQALQSHLAPYVPPGRDTQPPLPSGSPLIAFDVSVPGSVPNFQIYSEKLSSVAGHSMPSASSQAILDSRYSWVSLSASNKLNVETYTSNSSTRPLPPLPTTPPPFSSPLITQSSAIHSGSQSSVYSQTAQLSLPSTPGIFSTSGSTLATFSLPPFAPWQASLSGTLFSSMSQQPGQNPPAMPQTNPSPQPSIQSLQPRPPPPPPPPQAPRPPNPQNSRPAIQVSHLPSEQVVSLQNPIQVQVQPLQVQQQLQIPQIVYYQPQQQENLLHPPQPSIEQSQSQKLPPPDNKVQQQDSGMSLQQYFSSPEAIQSLLSDRDKLCQLLEQHPKLMQMLQVGNPILRCSDIDSLIYKLLTELPYSFHRNTKIRSAWVSYREDSAVKLGPFLKSDIVFVDRAAYVHGESSGVTTRT